MNKRVRENEIPSGRRLPKKHKKAKLFNKGIAYFLVFLMLLGNLQALSYAEGNAREVAEQIGVQVEKATEALKETAEEKNSEVSLEASLKDESKDDKESSEEKEADSSVEKKEENKAEEKDEAALENEEKSENSSEEKADTEHSEEEKKAEETENEKKPGYMEAGIFESNFEDGLTVTASYGEGTFLEGTFMKLAPVAEEVLTEAKSYAEKEYEKKHPGEKPELSVLNAVDISFYREINGVEKEVQPKQGKKVEIRFNKTKEIKEAIEEDEKELQLVHLHEGKPAEILKLKDEGEDLAFSAKNFSPSVLLAVAGTVQTPEGHELRAFWREEPTAVNGHSYTDEIVEDSTITNAAEKAEKRMRQQKNLVIIPPEQGSNALNTSTLGIELTLKGGVDTAYAPGEVSIDIPARIFKGWDDPDKVNVSTAMDDSGAYPVKPPYVHGLPKKGESNAQSSFSYETIEKNGEAFLRLTNYKELSGGVTFKADIAYNLTPSMLKVTHKSVAGEEKGVYDYKFPVSMEVKNKRDSSLNSTAKQDMSVHVETKVNPTKVTLKPGKADVNGGVYFNWDPSWGTAPENANKYFYTVWYVQVDRATGSSQPFKYKFEPVASAADGGELVGAKKLPMDTRWNGYYHPDSIAAFPRGGYSNITEYMTEEPPADKKYMENPIGRTYEGISEDPSVPKLPSSEPYVLWDNYHPNGHLNSQVYALVYKYPYKKLEDAKAAGRDIYKDGLEISNKIKFTEIWADKFKRDIDVTVENRFVFPRPRGDGGFSYNKYNTGIRQNYVNIFGLQSIYQEGKDAPLRVGSYKESFTLTTDYKADSANVKVNEDGTYTTSPDSNKNGSGVTLRDGKYYLLSVRHKGEGSINGKPVSADLTKNDLEGLDSTTGTNTDAYREKYPLKDEDYYYSSIFLKEMRVRDVEKSNNALVPFSPKAELRKRNEDYPPVAVYLRKKNESTYFKYGQFSYNAGGQIIFTPESGFTKKYTKSDTENIYVGNQLDLHAVFGDSIVGLELKQDSPYYSTGFDVAYTMQVTPTAAMQAEIKKTMEKEDDYKISFIGGAATAEGRQLEVKKTEHRIGEYWAQVGYTLTPLEITPYLNKNVEKAYEDDPQNSVQTLNVRLEGFNYGDLPETLQEAKYTDPYQVNKGIIYDLLPAGTYVDEESIKLGTWTWGYNVDSNLSFTKGTDYTVEFNRDWEGSGRTMMIVRFTTPENTESKQYRRWQKDSNRSGWKMTYTLYNPYTNIADRGRTAVNTVGYVHQDENTIWDGNYVSDEEGKYPKLTDISHYKKIREEEAGKNSKFTTSVVAANMNFGPITVVEANFNNTVSTEINPDFIADNVSYMGDPYKHRLLYRAEPSTRTTDMVLYDILGKDAERNGDFAGVDISSMLTKPSYPNSSETLKPRVFVAEKVPTEAERDLTNPIWKEWNYEDESLNGSIDKKKVQAVAFDLRKTKSGQDFTLNKEGILVANVKMTATTDQNKENVQSGNIAYLNAVQYNTDTRPNNAKAETLQAGSVHRLVKPLVFSIPVKKVLDVPAGLAAPDIQNKFTFTLRGVDGAPLLNEEGKASITELKNPDSDGGLMEFGKIRILKPGKYTYKLAETAGNVAGVSLVNMGEQEISLTVENKNNQALESDLKYSANNPFIFKNIYNVKAIDAEIKVQKKLSGKAGLIKPDIRNKFSFTLQREDANAPMPAEAGAESSLVKTNPNSDGGEISFGKVHLTAPGTYRYSVTESGSVPGVKNDEKPKREIVVTVTDEGNGELYATVGGDDFIFNNVFETKAVFGKIELGKKISGTNPGSNDTFHFVLRKDSTEVASASELPRELVQPMPGDSQADTETVAIQGEGSTAFAPISFQIPGVYSYTLEEVNDAIYGYTYDKSVYRVVYTVSQDSRNQENLLLTQKIFKNGEEVSEILFENQFRRNSGGGGGGGSTPRVPSTPGTPSIPGTVEGNVPHPGDVLGQNRPSGSEEETKQSGEVLGENRTKKHSRAVRTDDSSKMLWYAFASAMSLACLGIYYVLGKKKKRG